MESPLWKHQTGNRHVRFINDRQTYLSCTPSDSLWLRCIIIVPWNNKVHKIGYTVKFLYYFTDMNQTWNLSNPTANHMVFSPGCAECKSHTLCLNRRCTDGVTLPWANSLSASVWFMTLLLCKYYMDRIKLSISQRDTCLVTHSLLSSTFFHGTFEQLWVVSLWFFLLWLRGTLSYTGVKTPLVPRLVLHSLGCFYKTELRLFRDQVVNTWKLTMVVLSNMNLYKTVDWGFRYFYSCKK